MEKGKRAENRKREGMKKDRINSGKQKKGKKEWRFKGKWFQESAELRRFKMALKEANQANLIYQ